MNTVLVLCALTISIISVAGCATKTYVRQQATQVLNKVNELDQLTAENTKEIKNVDARAQQAIQAAGANADQLGQKAATADNKAQQAKAAAETCESKTIALATTVSNLDNYHTITQTRVQFGFNSSRLTPQSEQQLDQLGSQLSVAKGYVVVVEAGTDSTGSKEYNYDLSQRRAEEVVRYLSAKYSLPPYKVYAVGLGDERPVAPDDTHAGRQQNRSAEVQLMSNVGGHGSSRQGATDDDEEEVGKVIPNRH